MSISPEQVWNFALPLVGAASGGVGCYVALRVELARLHERVQATREDLDSLKGELRGVSARFYEFSQRK